MNNMLVIILVVLILMVAGLCCYFFVGSAPVPKKITWGVNFSQMQSQNLKLDWKKNYLAILEDLGAKNIKLLTQWDFLEGKKDSLYFNDVDWQIRQAESHGASLTYVLGLKTGRWPECHMPAWATGLSKADQQEALFSYVKQVVLRYKDSKAITAWQVENEPFFNFGECPDWYYKDKDFVARETALVKSLDPSRPVVISDSGDFHFWGKPASIGDVVGITMYKKVWVSLAANYGFYVDYFFPGVYYWRKALLIQFFYGKKVICGELQAEPWLSKPFYGSSLEDQEKSMDLEQFKANITFAKTTGIDTFYLWGAEWWYWLKVTQNKPEIWNAARELLK